MIVGVDAYIAYIVLIKPPVFCSAVEAAVLIR